MIAIPLFVAVTPVSIPRLDEASVSLRVLGLALALIAGMTVTFGLVPSLVLVRRHAADDLKAGGRGSSRDTRRLHQGLVVAEVALACALLVASALLVRTVGAMTRVPLGVAPTNVVLTGVQVSAGFNSDAWAKLASRAGAPSSIASAPSLASSRPAAPTILPFEHGWRNPFQPADQTFGRPEDRPQVQYHSVSDGYFETMGARLIEGRAFTAYDTPDGEAVAIVNETLARRYYPRQVGRRTRDRGDAVAGRSRWRAT